ncbi:MAG: substrate-binding domain-containing protein [Methanospirillaceae archaeon]|nr:substrate-binding domain-containing protein [Methanospirillaceae archaeon]
MNRGNDRIIPVILFGLFFFAGTGIAMADFDNPGVALLPADGELFSDAVRAGIKDAIKDYSLSIEIINPESCVAEDMVIAAFDALAQKPSAILLYPTDRDLFSPVILAAESEGIPALLIGADLPEKENTWFIGSDNHRMGILAADYLASVLRDNDTLIILMQDEYMPASRTRAESCKEQIKAKDSSINVRFCEIGKDSNYQSVFSSILADEPAVKGIFAADSFTTRIISGLIKDYGMEGSLAVVGVNGGDDAQKVLDLGIIRELYHENPYQMGYRTGEVLTSLTKGQDVSKKTYIDFSTDISDIPIDLSDTPSAPDSSVYQVNPSSPLSEIPQPEETLSYEERLMAAAGRYDFNSMTAQNEISHYSNSRLIAQRQAALEYAMSGNRIATNYDIVGYNLIHR